MKKSQTCMETRLLKNCLILLLPDMSFLEKKNGHSVTYLLQ